jgi:hypothetical protein
MYKVKNAKDCQHQGLIPIILATCETEIKKIVGSRPARANSSQPHFQNNQRKID